MRVRLELRVVRGRGDERAGLDEVVEQRLRERRALGRVRARTELVEQHERPRPGGIDDPDDRAHVARERRQRLGDRLLVADVGEDVAEHRQPRAGRGRQVQAGLVHQREQPERAQRHGLAAGVRAGDDEGREAVTESDVDGHDVPGQTRVARGQEDDLRARRRLRAGRAHLAGELGLGRPQVEAGQRAKRLAERPGIRADQRRQLIEDPFDLLPLGQLRFAPGVAELDHDERLDEKGLAAPGRVMDDALDPVLGIGADRHDVASVPERDDRLLERAGELGADEGVEPALQPIECDPDGGAKPAQPRRRGVEELASRVERASQGRRDGRQRVEAPAQLALERPARVREVRLEQGSRVEGRPDVEELLRI